MRPSGLNATEPTPLVDPVSGCPIRVAWAGSVTFHSQMLAEEAADGQGVPVRAERHRADAAVGPVRGCPIWVAWAWPGR